MSASALDKDDTKTLIEHFERMHLHHLSSQHKTKEYCKRQFKNKLKQWTGSDKFPRGTKTYTDVCTDRRKRHCNYVIRVFNKDNVGKIQFAHELRTLMTLSDHKVDFIPQVHTAFLCDQYGLLVQSKWRGDILDLLFSKHEDQLESTFQRAYHMAQIMMAELHRIGICYGHNVIDFRNLIYCDNPTCPDVLKSDAGFHLGLQDWREARPLSTSRAEQDLHQMNVLFMHISQLLHALRHHEPKLPDHLPNGMLAKAEKLREGKK